MAKADGLIGAYLLREGGGMALDGWQAVRDWQPGHGVLWVHLPVDSPEAKRWLEEQSGLEELEVEALLAEETRPRVAAWEHTMLVLLRGVNLNPGEQPEDMVSIRLWSDGQRIISTRLRSLRAVRSLREDLTAGRGPATVAEFMVELSGRLADNMEQVIEEMKDRMDGLEEALLTHETHAQHRPLSYLRQHAVQLRRYMAPQRDAMNRLQSERVPWIDDDARTHLREVGDTFTRYLEDIDALRERATIMREELAGRLAERLERRMYALAIISTVFLPLTFITGLLGMNVGGIPMAESAWGFFGVAGVVLLVLVVQLALMRWRRWI